jgi:hypothetical protein
VPYVDVVAYRVFLTRALDPIPVVCLRYSKEVLITGRRFRFDAVTALAVLLYCPNLLFSQEVSQNRVPLSALTLEQLSQIQVTSVGRRPQRVSETTAAVSVITSDDIRRSGARSIAEALRLATGVEVARSGGNSWLSAHGDSTPALPTSCKFWLTGAASIRRCSPARSGTSRAFCWKTSTASK